MAINQSIKDILSPEYIKKSSIPSNYRLGEQIAREGKIEFLENHPDKIEAKISAAKSTSGRRVIFEMRASGFYYKCTCSNKPDWFCKHCVAVGLKMLT